MACVFSQSRSLSPCVLLLVVSVRPRSAAAPFACVVVGGLPIYTHMRRASGIPVMNRLFVMCVACVVGVAALCSVINVYGVMLCVHAGARAPAELVFVRYPGRGALCPLPWWVAGWAASPSLDPCAAA